MAPRANRNPGFSLIEVVVALAIIAILAGAMAPLAIKALNQAREQRTRTDLKTAYEALFGARDRSVSNMRADYGYDGTGSLAQMTTRGAIRPYGVYGTQPALTGGWNGPYWTGMQSATGLPEDAWGRPFQLRLIAGGYQLLSLGENGALNSPGPNPGGDDLVYPLPPTPPASTPISINVWKIVPGPPTILSPVASAAVTVQCPSATNMPFSPVVSGATNPYSTSAPPGNAVVTVKVGAQIQSQAVSLAAGAQVTLNFYF